MNLLPRLKVEETVTAFNLTDCTGLYSFENKGGYGAQTIRPEWITEATVVVKHVRSGKVSGRINVMDNLAKNEGFFQINPWNIDSSWKVFMVGKYEFIYSIKATIPRTGEKRNPTTTAVCVSIIPAECCVDKMTGKTYNVPMHSLFKDERSRKLAELSVLMNRIKKAVDCKDWDSADRMVYDISINCDCNCN